MIYIYCGNLNEDGFIGIKKKILAQCRVFRKSFDIVYYTIFAGQMIYLLDEDKIIDKEYAITKRDCYKAILKWILKYNIQRTYIRYYLSDIWFIDFLSEQKKMGVKSVLEFPTIPYDNEGWIIRPLEDRYYREELYKYIDRCTTYSNCETVFNIPCMPLINGVDITEQKEKLYRKKDGTIKLLAVATLSKWHGYERLLYGLHNYYLNGGGRTITFNIVGEGGQLQYYKHIVEENQLGKHVVFYGKLEGEKLDKIYDESDIAIGSLGFYKANLQSGAPIKLREYCARGIPFIYGYDDISFNDDNYFGYRMSNDETPVDIQNIIHFYDEMYDGRDFIKDMRAYTMSKLTWDKILQPVIEYLC